MSTTYPCSTPITVGPPVQHKFRTGSYLIYDDPGGDSHCRQGTKLTNTPFRASGSRQLDVSRLTDILSKVPLSGGQLYLVDLREETHLFFDGCAVSWYADKDFANVGQPLEWIVAQERAQLTVITKVPVTKIFCLKEDATTGNVTPTGYKEESVKVALTEEMVAISLPPAFRPKYIRIPVTDHCSPSVDAIVSFVEFCRSLNQNDWVHCHCHGGDGRTTSFLAMFDMVNWAKKNGTSGFPTIENFAHRQCELFNYCLNPDGCGDNTCTSGISKTSDWKYYLARDRWLVLTGVRDWIAGGGLMSETPFVLPDV